jgi:hypothetical protein
MGVYELMDTLNFTDTVSFVALLMLLVLMIYTVLNYRETSFALKKYGDIIKKSMDIEEVKKFILSHKRIKVQVEEDNSTVKIYWVTNHKYPYVLVYFDRSQGKFTKVFFVEAEENEVNTRSA